MKSVLTLSLFSMQLLSAPILGILQHIGYDGSFHFKVERVGVICHPYGIISLHELLYAPSTSKRCKATLEKYFQTYPKDFYFSSYHNIYAQQKYHLEFYTDASRCTIYTQGRVSYARELLQNGLAQVEKGFKNKLLQERYKEDELNAKALKVGMYRSFVPRDCISEFLKR